jgi:hypothetical protein
MQSMSIRFFKETEQFILMFSKLRHDISFKSGRHYNMVLVDIDKASEWNVSGGVTTVKTNSLRLFSIVTYVTIGTLCLGKVSSSKIHHEN